MGIVLNSRSWADSKLHLEIPVDEPNQEFVVEIQVHPKLPARKGWPSGYSELFGSIDDETFTVHPQPPMPPTLDIE